MIQIKRFIFPTIIGFFVVFLIGGGFWCCSNPKNSKNPSTKKEINSNKYLSIESILDMYRNKKKEYIINVLENNGYHLSKSDKEVECWTKDVQLKDVNIENGNVYYDPVEPKGSCVKIYGSDDSLELFFFVYTEDDFKEWEIQLSKLGYKEKSYGEDLPDEDGWTRIGAHNNLCKLYEDGKDNSIQFMKDGDGHPGYDIYIVEFASVEETINEDVVPDTVI